MSPWHRIDREDAIQTAVTRAQRGEMTKEAALLSVDPAEVGAQVSLQIHDLSALAASGVDPLVVGLPASPGAASGRLVFQADAAVAQAKRGVPVVLVRRETGREDNEGMQAAEATVSTTGGLTSHAAIVSRGLRKPCVAGLPGVEVDGPNQRVRVVGQGGATVLTAGDWLTVDGTSGAVYGGALALVPDRDEHVATLLEWADAIRAPRLWGTACSAPLAATAKRLGADGIGPNLVTDHAFGGAAGWLDDPDHWLSVLRAADGIPLVVPLEASRPPQDDDGAEPGQLRALCNAINTFCDEGGAAKLELVFSELPEDPRGSWAEEVGFAESPGNLSLRCSLRVRSRECLGRVEGLAADRNGVVLDLDRLTAELDRDGSEALEEAVRVVRNTAPELSIGVCAAAAHTALVDRVEALGVTWLACPPSELVAARIAAAQSVLRGKGG